MKHNEDTRVKIPAILHLVRLGYEYLSLKGAVWDESTNIFTDVFNKSIAKINPDIEEDEITRLLQDISLSLENEDLGQVFYSKLTDKSGIKLIDFENFDNNTFNVVTELTYKNGDEEFRPDIILLVNGMPLSFIEVKKPNNRDGVLAERKRINQRFSNKKFRKFVNITQLMMFSNNMEYDDMSSSPIQGAFYASPSYSEAKFNFFREEEHLDLSNLLKCEDDRIEDFILRDTNYQMIKSSPEFLINKEPNTPTNRLLTSLFSKERLSFILQYTIAYVKAKKGIEKHIMRYPQIFATKAIENKLEEGIKKGIIWHTQGSGKTALAYYNVKYLTDYYQKKNIIPKFYFIVDRIDLLIQAKREFSARGLVVHTVSSKDEFAKIIKLQSAINNQSGKAEITVVNIQKFSDEAKVVSQKDYNIDIQRIYFLDEVHRSYNPKGSFLANLIESDRNAITIGLTGTPLLGDDYNSKLLFGDYIHKYYYNASIADGYTLRLIREDIETNYKITLQKALEELEVLKGDIPKKEIFAHTKFVEPMLKYIVEDFEKSRKTFADSGMGAMVVCDSADQAKEMFQIFEKKYATQDKDDDFKVTTAQLILHDIGDKTQKKDWVEDFKEGKIDMLFVFNMLLTGFDAPRLKKLYLGRVIKKHNLLQALTRANRIYKEFKYGYVVDFADITKEFEATNRAYFDELQSELGSEIEHYSNLFKSIDEIKEEIEEIKDVLFNFDIDNAELFSQQISHIQDIKQMQEIKKVLGNAKSLYNLIRLYGHYDLLEKMDFNKLSKLYTEVTNHLNLLNLKNNLESQGDTTNLLNVALEDIIFMFIKIDEKELVLADKLKDTLRKTREALGSNFDQKDAEFITLKEELERLFKKKNLNEITQDEMKKNIGSLNDIYEKIKELNRKNNLLKEKYNNDEKYARTHKRIVQRGDMSLKKRQVYDALIAIKEKADEDVLKNTKVLDNEDYFDKGMLRLVVNEFKNSANTPLKTEPLKYINTLVVKEYINEFNGVVNW